MPEERSRLHGSDAGVEHRKDKNGTKARGSSTVFPGSAALRTRIGLRRLLVLLLAPMPIVSTVTGCIGDVFAAAGYQLSGHIRHAETGEAISYAHVLVDVEPRGDLALGPDWFRADASGSLQAFWATDLGSWAVLPLGIEWPGRSALEAPTVPDRVTLSVDSDGTTVEVVIEITEDMISESSTRTVIVIDLGTIFVSGTE